MYRKFLILLLFFTLLPAVSWPFSSGFEKLFIDEVQYKGTFVVDFDEVYIPETAIENILRRKDISWDGATLAVIVGDRAISSRIITYEGKPYYPFLAICRELKYQVSWDYGKKIISVILKEKPAQTIATFSDDGQQEPQRKRRNRGIVISLFHEDFIKNVMESVVAVRIKADVINTFKRDSKKVVARCVFSYPDGAVHYEDTVFLEDLKAGEIRRVVFYTTNPSASQTLTYKLSVEEVKEP